GEGRYPRRERVGNAALIEPAQLLGQSAEDGKIARLQSSDVETFLMCSDELGLHLVERHCSGVDDASAVRGKGQQLPRDDRAGVEADRAAGDEIAAAHGDEVGSAGPSADEMHRHGEESVSASAQVAGPSAIRERTSFAWGPPAARAAASATDGTPLSARTRSDRPSQPAAAASRSGSGTKRRGRP